jgi:hypothetical protein
MTATRTMTGVGVLIAVLLLVGNVVMTHNTLTEPYPGHNDFMTPWEASRAFFYDGLDPYSAEVSLSIQERLYGRAALPDEQPNHFAYPFYTILFTWPVIHVDYAWASAIWMVVLEVALIASLGLLLSLYDWRPRPLTLAGLALFMLFAYPGARGLILGQVSHPVFFLQVLALWGLAKDRDRLAGAALAMSTFKPQMSVFLVPLLLIWGLYTRRWSFLAAFAVMMAVLLGASFLLLPDWVSGFTNQLTLYPSYIEVSTPAWVIAQWILNLGQPLEIALNLLGLGFMLWSWFTVFVQKHHERFTWALMITLTMTHLIGLRTASPHFVVFVIPLLFYLRAWAKRRKGGWIAGTLAALLVLPWLHFLLTIGDAKFESPTVFLFMPLLTLIVLIATRERWWQAPPLLSTESKADSDQSAALWRTAERP